MNIDKIEAHLKRMKQTRDQYIKDNKDTNIDDLTCIFVGDDDGIYSPFCEPKVRVHNSVVYRWLKTSETCPFCGLHSGSIR